MLHSDLSPGDLVGGSGLAFEDAGEHELKGVPDRWRLYRGDVADDLSPVEVRACRVGSARLRGSELGDPVV